MKILLVEDNQIIARGLLYSFRLNGYDSDNTLNIKDTIKYIEDNNDIDLFILDVMLPDGNSLDLYKNYIKKLDKPVIFLSAVDSEDTIVDALESGCAEYITKPFSTRELLVRIKRILVSRNKLIKVDDIEYDMDKMIVYKNGIEIKLTAIENRLVNLMFSNINKVVTRSIILDRIWEWTGNYIDDHTVTVYFKRIREKLGSDIIKTIKGIGYRIDG